MRVISQDGTIDVPYDYFSLSVASGKYEDVEVAYIYCHNLSSPNGTKLAEYSTEAKAIKVMEMLRDQSKPFLISLIGIPQSRISVSPLSEVSR